MVQPVGPSQPEAQINDRISFKIFLGMDITDTGVFDELISGDEQGVYADKAYYDKKRAEELETKGMKNGLMKRGARGKPLSKSDKARNKKLPKIRAQVERPFGIIKSKWGHNRARYLGLFRNSLSYVKLRVYTNYSQKSKPFLEVSI